MNNLYTLRNFVSAKMFAVFTIVSLILSAFPASFLVANAQEQIAVAPLSCTLAPTFDQDVTEGTWYFWNFDISGDTSGVALGKVYYDGEFDRNIDPFLIDDVASATFIINNDEKPVSEIRVDLVDDSDNQNVLASCSTTLTQDISGDITGSKYDDSDNDGSIDEERKIPGWEMRLYRVGEGWEFVETTTTDENGEYWFTDLSPGEYKVCELLPPGWTQTFVSSGTTNESPNASEEGPKCQTVNIDEDGEENTRNFGNYFKKPERPTCEIGENLLENGSFEEPEVTNSSLWQKMASVVGWVIEKVSDDSSTTLELMRGWSGNEAADGEQYAELDGDHSTKVSQTVDTLEGATYELSWAFAPRHNIAAEHNQLAVSVDGSLVATEGPATGSAGLEEEDWTRSSYTFKADSDETVITFADAGPSNSYGTYLDDAALCLVKKPEPTATLHATKIECEDESLLPNDGYSSIGETTAADFLTSTPEREQGCEIVDWRFEWAPFGTSDPGDTLTGPAGDPWTTFSGSTEIPFSAIEDGKFWVREILPEGYIPFTHGPSGNNNSNDETAELYCHTDAKNYDNYDRVDNPEVGGDYYCVAWNVQEESDNTAKVSGQKWEDYNQNGVLDEGEPAIEGVTICAENLETNEVHCTETDEYGAYVFHDAEEGVDCRIYEEVEEPWIQTAPESGYCDILDPVAGEEYFCDFGNYNPLTDFGPYCGDGEVNQDWEMCEPGDEGCTDYCTWDNQCTDLKLAKVNFTQAPDSVSFDETLLLGADDALHPAGAWFNLDDVQNGDADDIAEETDALVISNDGSELTFAVWGGNGSNKFDYVFADIHFLGVDLGLLDDSPIPGWPLETSGDWVDVWDKDGDEKITMEWYLTTGGDAASVAYAMGEEYDCPECKATVEARIVVDEYGTNGEGDLSDEIVLGDAGYTTVGFGEWFPISEAPAPGESAVMISDPNTVTNFDDPADKPGLFVSRENGTVKVALYGEHQPGGNTNNEWIDARIEIRDAEITNYMPLTGDFKLENHPENNGVPTNDGYDEVSADDTGVDFKLWVDTASDGFKFDIDHEEIVPCDEDTEEKWLVDGYKYEGEYGNDVDTVPGWPIYLYEGDTDNLVMSTTTDEEGYYYFWVGEGEWRVEEGEQLGWYQVGVDDGGDYDYTDDEPEYCYFELPHEEHDDFPVFNSISLILNEVEYNYSDHRCDFYNERHDDLIIIDGYKWGIEYDYIYGVEGWVIELHDESGVVASTTTNENGYYYFEVPEGEYEVHEVMQEGWMQYDISTNGYQEYDEYSDLYVCDLTEYNDFDLLAVARIAVDDDYESDYYCNFYNKQIPLHLIDGYKRDQSGVGVSGWTIELHDEGGLVDSTTTNSSGYYYFEVPAGVYEVREVMQSEWHQIGITAYGGYATVDQDLNYCVLEVEDYLYQQTFTRVTDEILPPNDNQEYGCDFDNEYDNEGGGSSGTRTGGGGSGPSGQVAGASTMCPFLEDYMQIGWENDPFEVMKLQMFLNMIMGESLEITGVFDRATDEAVKRFQERYHDDVLNPWFNQGIVPHDQPTGFVYKTTRWKINDIVCPGFDSYPSFEGEDLNSNIDED